MVTSAGNVLGAFVAAMLYDTVGPALLATLASDEFQSTLQMSVTFLRPVRPGRLIGKGCIRQRNGDVAALEATLFDDEGFAIAATTAIARGRCRRARPASAESSWMAPDRLGRRH